MTETITVTEGRYNRSCAVCMLFLTLSFVCVIAGGIAVAYSHSPVGWGLLGIGVFYYLCGDSVSSRGLAHRAFSIVGMELDWVLDDVDTDELAEGPVEVEVHD